MNLNGKTGSHLMMATGMIAIALLLSACSVTRVKAPVEVAPPAEVAPTAEVAPPAEVATPIVSVEIEDLTRIPQQFAGLAKAAGDRLAIGDGCRTQLHDEFKRQFFGPWTSSAPLFDPADAKEFMKQEGRRNNWYGVNKRKVPRKQMQELLENCNLRGFPSRNDPAISVAPSHMRGLPTRLPLYDGPGEQPFDMLSYPHVKLNEPLRVLHVSQDGVWVFVETGYTNGWLEARDVALVDGAYVKSRMQAPQVVISRDYTPVADGKQVGTFSSKIGTILPVVSAGKSWWEVSIASAGEGGKAENRTSRIPRDAAAAFPLDFDKEQISKIGGELLGQPYGWGEIYGLRDCSALLRDFFLPFGVWLPRTSKDQVDSVPRRVPLGSLAPPEKSALIKEKAIPFLTLLYMPGHIALYLGVDGEGRPLVFQDAWSIRVKDGDRKRKQIIGMSAVTTLEPGRELGLIPGSSLLERSTELATITQRCRQLPQ